MSALLTRCAALLSTKRLLNAILNRCVARITTRLSVSPSLLLLFLLLLVAALLQASVASSVLAGICNMNYTGVLIHLLLLASRGSRSDPDSSFRGLWSLSLLAVLAGRTPGPVVLQLLLLLDDSFLPADGRHRGTAGGIGVVGGGRSWRRTEQLVTASAVNGTKAALPCFHADSCLLSLG